MRDISFKQISLRTAKAVGVVLCSASTLERIKTDQLPKGNALDVARAAAFLAAKNTHNLIPHCHPVSIDGMNLTYEYLDATHIPEVVSELKGQFGVIIYCEGKSIGRTGIEMEVLTAVSIAGLTIYDLLKPLDDKDLAISSIKLLEKKGGKSDKKRYVSESYTAAVLVCSDAADAGKRDDVSGKKIQTMLENINVQTVDYQIVPDEITDIQEKIREWIRQDIPFIFTTGGTGFSPRDCTVEAVRDLIEREATGISEAIRAHGQMRTPTAMLSRAISGVVGKSLIVTLPGSPKGVQESLEAILPQIFHVRKMLEGEGH